MAAPWDSTCWGLLVRCCSAAPPAVLLGWERRNRELRSRGKPPASSQPGAGAPSHRTPPGSGLNLQVPPPSRATSQGEIQGESCLLEGFFSGDLPGGVSVSGIGHGKLRNKAEPCQASCTRNRDGSPEKLPLPRFNRNRGSTQHWRVWIRQKVGSGL